MLPTITNKHQQTPTMTNKAPTIMKHTNEIIIGVLKEAHSDYDVNNWHYDSEYIMIEKAINNTLSQQSKEKGLLLCTPTLKDLNTLYFRRNTKKLRKHMFEVACNLPDEERRLTKEQFKALMSVWGVPKGYAKEDFNINQQ